MSFGKKAMMAGLLMAAIFCTVSASAEETRVTRPVWDQMTEKFGRGIANIAFGPLELLMKPYDVANDDGAIPALTYGVFKGVIYTVARELVGITDVVTFFMPLPGLPNDPEHGAGWGYGPFFTPEGILTPATDPYNVAYPQTGYID